MSGTKSTITRIYKLKSSYAREHKGFKKMQFKNTALTEQFQNPITKLQD